MTIKREKRWDRGTGLKFIVNTVLKNGVEFDVIQKRWGFSAPLVVRGKVSPFIHVQLS